MNTKILKKFSAKPVTAWNSGYNENILNKEGFTFYAKNRKLYSWIRPW